MSAVSPREITQLEPWFHNLHLPDGTQTAPNHWLGDFPMVKWRQLAPSIPRDLTGWTVLDIGCNAGFYSFELARRGAHVTAIDVEPHYLKQARWAARIYGLQERIQFREASLYCVADWGVQYDLVGFLGVMYHLRHPLLALDILRTITRRQLVFQTMTMPGEEEIDPPADLRLQEREILNAPGWPRMAFIERQLEQDPTNWWAPNHACVQAMLRSAGFRITARPGHEMYICEPNAQESPLVKRLRESELHTVLGIRSTAGEAGS